MTDNMNLLSIIDVCFQNESGELIFAFGYYKFNLILYFLLYVIYLKLSLD